MSRELFVDTSAWYSLADPRHPDHHRMAGILMDRVASGIRIVTTNLILAETHTLLLRRVGREGAIRFTREARREPLMVEYSTADLERRAVEEWLAVFQDQDFSLADGVSFAVMKERGIVEALTLDHHFAVAGFVVVPG